MNIAIIGAGACGLMLATRLEKKNIKYSIFNLGKIGNKILASGNGKCNIANVIYEDTKYHNNPLAQYIVGTNHQELLSYLKELKIYTKFDEQGRMYPISESSLSVLNVLLSNIKTPIIQEEIKKIEKKDNQYYLNEVYGPFTHIVFSTGSIASYKKPYLGMEIINALDVKVNPFKPSLVGFKTNSNFKEISGVRAKCMASLYQKDKLIHKEYGEVIFKDNGISGICIMNLSSYYNHLETNKDCNIVLELVEKDYDDYSTVIHPKLLKYIEAYKINIKKFIIPIIGVYDYEFAQVCSGGIDIKEINETLRLKKDSNIFVGGEIIDVDGVCGGYNLMFAFCCSIVIEKELTNEISN